MYVRVCVNQTQPVFSSQSRCCLSDSPRSTYVPVRYLILKRIIADRHETNSSRALRFLAARPMALAAAA